MSIGEFFAQYGLFLVELLSAVVLLAAAVLFMILLSRRHSDHVGSMNVEKLNDKFDETRDAVNRVLLDKKAFRHQKKELSKKSRDERDKDERERVYVLDFKGDVHASANVSLREEINAILSVARKGETVLLRLENAGGTVHEHGLAASQLLRLKSHDLKLVIAVDKVAASGGYLMACVADTILAAPFAIVGSIGVLTQLPNFHRWLESRGVDFEQVTAGKFKRTLTVFGENTDEDRAKVREELEEIHALFKARISEYRPQVDIEAVATGEHWYGVKALELALVDAIQTSDEYVRERVAEADVYRFEFRRKKTVHERVLETAQAFMSR